MKNVLLALLVLILTQVACSFANSGKVNQLVSKADQLVDQKKYSEAIVIYDKAIELNPKSSPAYTGRGKANRLLENYQQALSDLDKAIEFDNKNFKAYRERGMAYYMTDDLASALSDCKKSVALNNDFALGHLCLGYIYDDSGEYDSAYSEYTTTIKLDSKEMRAYASRGKIAFLHHHNYKQAIEDFTKAFEIEPESNRADLYYYRGFSYYALDDYDNAILDFKKSISITGDSNDSHYGLGDIYLVKKEYYEAIKHYSLGITNAPSKITLAYLYRGIAYDETGQMEEALADYSAYLELDSRDNEGTRYACSRANLLTLGSSTNIFSLFFNVIAPPCSRFNDSSGQYYTSDDPYQYENSEESICGGGMSVDQCSAAIQAREEQFQQQLQQETSP